MILKVIDNMHQFTDAQFLRGMLCLRWKNPALCAIN